MDRNYWAYTCSSMDKTALCSTPSFHNLRSSSRLKWRSVLQEFKSSFIFLIFSRDSKMKIKNIQVLLNCDYSVYNFINLNLFEKDKYDVINIKIILKSFLSCYCKHISKNHHRSLDLCALLWLQLYLFVYCLNSLLFYWEVSGFNSLIIINKVNIKTTAK